MKISGMILELSQLLVAHGDVSCFLERRMGVGHQRDDDQYHAIDCVQIDEVRVVEGDGRKVVHQVVRILEGYSLEVVS